MFYNYNTYIPQALLAVFNWSTDGEVPYCMFLDFMIQLLGVVCSLLRLHHFCRGNNIAYLVITFGGAEHVQQTPTDHFGLLETVCKELVEKSLDEVPGGSLNLFAQSSANSS